MTKVETYAKLLERLDDGANHRGYPEEFGGSWSNICSAAASAIRVLIKQIDQPQSPQEPVMWRCKDYADGWITFRTESSAKHYQSETGCLMQPLYADTRPDRNFNQEKNHD